MSIFPKRTIQGSTVTIHWNFNTSKLKRSHRFPLVRIGVKDPNGKVTMLFEKHVLALPMVNDEQQSLQENRPLHLNKNLPILLVANYLSGQHNREKLVDILENIQAGRHYYFSFVVPENAPLGKYSLISEVISEGHLQYSSTAADDFFYVEKVALSESFINGDRVNTMLKNCSPEAVPVKIVNYHPNKNMEACDVQAFELLGFEEREIVSDRHFSYLIYNEEREMQPIALTSPLVVKNPNYLFLEKDAENSTYVFNRSNEDGYMLENIHREIWHQANGLHQKIDIALADHIQVYEEMLEANLISELTGDEFH
jgi:hypothetical protein